MVHELSNLYLEVQNEKQKWDHPVDGRLVGERLDLLFSAFSKSTGWPHDKIWFNAADMPIEARHKPSEVLSTIDKWYAVSAEFDCGINGVKKAKFPIYARGNQSNQYRVIINQTVMDWEGEEDMSAIVRKIADTVREEFAKLEIVRKEFGQI